MNHAPNPRTQPTETEEQPEAAAARLASKRVIRFGLLMLLTLLLQGLDLPWRMSAVPIGAFGAGYGILAIITAWRARVRGLTIPAALTGTILCAFMSFGTLLTVFVWQIEIDHQTCVNSAITETARTKCERTYTHDLEQWRTNLEARFK